MGGKTLKEVEDEIASTLPGWEVFEKTLDHLRNLDTQVAIKEQEYKDAKQEFRDAMLNSKPAIDKLCSEADNHDLHGVVKSLLYWKYDFIQSRVIKGDSLKDNKHNAIIPLETTVVCSRCGGEHRIEVKSRTELSEVRRHGPLCPDCKQKQRESEAQYRLSQQTKRDQEIAQIEFLRRLPYKEYLQSEHWKSVRAYMIKRAHFKCELCGKTGESLNVHHNSYEHRGDEQNHMGDLIVLCHTCHAKFHDKLEEVINE